MCHVPLWDVGWELVGVPAPRVSGGCSSCTTERSASTNTSTSCFVLYSPRERRTVPGTRKRCIAGWLQWSPAARKVEESTLVGPGQEQEWALHSGCCHTFLPWNASMHITVPASRPTPRGGVGTGADGDTTEVQQAADVQVVAAPHHKAQDGALKGGSWQRPCASTIIKPEVSPILGHGSSK